MANKVIITDEIMDSVWKGQRTVNELLSEKYYGEIQDKIKEDARFAKMTPMQIVLHDAGITKKTHIGDVTNSTGTISTQQRLEWVVPAYIDTVLHEFIDKNDILSYVVKSIDTVSSRIIQSHYLDMTDPDNLDNTELALVDEGTDLPLATIKLGEQAIRLRKFGRAVEQTYEAMNEMTFDSFTKILELIASDASNQQLKRAIMVALRGDGNNNAAQEITIDKTAVKTDDEALKKALVKAFVQYSRSTKVPVTTIVAGGATFERLLMLGFKNDMTPGVGGGYTFSAPQYSISNIQLVDYGTNELKVGKSYNKNGILLLNDSMSLTKHFLNGSKIREYNTNIRNQTRLGTISEIAGFSKNTPDGVKYIQIEQ